MESSGKLTDLLTPAQTTNYGAVTVVGPRLDKNQAEQATSGTSSSSSGGGRGRGCCQVRLLLYTLIFLAGSISYALRVSLSQALVAMVNDTSHHAAYNVSNDTDLQACPHDDVNATWPDDDVTTSGAKFDWDRNAQGAVLAAFYYGYALIQVNYKRKYGGAPPSEKNGQQKRYVFSATCDIRVSRSCYEHDVRHSVCLSV